MTAPWLTTDEVTVWHGDCLDVLRTLPDASVDAVVTDPPYGLDFMGKDWDSFGRDTGNGYREKPRITKRVADPNDGTSSGYARAGAVNSFQAGRPFQAWCTEWATECLRVLKPGGHMLAFGGSRTWHRLATAVEDAGFEIRDSIAWLYGSGFPKSLDVSKAIDKGPGVDLPATDADRRWEGWGTALKPAFEPIVVARKPLVGTVAANVLAYGTGALNIDATRTATSDSLGGGAQTGSGLTTKSDGWSRPWMRDEDARAAHAARVSANVERAESLGRWPTNVVLDESQAAALDEQTGILTSGTMRAGTERQPRTGGTIYGADARTFTPADTYGDSGGASRFFPTFEMSAEDWAWELRVQNLPTFRYEAKAPSSERPKAGVVQHPTVKPLDLMRWLVRLVTPPKGLVLEPFAGSGTTVEAALLEGFRCIAIEREADYLPLIEQRITKPLQQSLFGDWDGAA